MNTREELLAALTVERYDNRWWVTPPAQADADDDLATARRRRAMVENFAHHGDPRVEAS